MAASPSEPGLLTLHAVRLQGMASAERVARRFSLAADEVAERLLDFEAVGWVTHSEFAGSGGWSLTARGRDEEERLLADELSRTAASDVVGRVHADFLPLNARLQAAMTRWQVRPAPGDPLARNDHDDHRWDDRTLDELASLGRGLAGLTATLESVLERFAGYSSRFDAALARAVGGEGRWVDGVGLDSCHTVWFELQEDLLATLGLTRG